MTIGMQGIKTWTALALVAAHAVSAAGSPPPVDDGSELGTINGESVTVGEYRLVMNRRTAEVFNFFKHQHGIDDGPGYWKESEEGPSPLTKLRELVLQELIQIKVRQSLARPRGLPAAASFNEFQIELAGENSRRKAALAVNAPVYGPREYDESSFYYIRNRELAYRLQLAIAAEITDMVEDAEVAKFYNENRSIFDGHSLEEVGRNIRKALGIRAAEESIRQSCASADVRLNENLLRGVVPRRDGE